MPVTIKHVAAEAGVSPSTVSRVLTGDERISPPTVRKVREAMERLSYHPNAIARSLVRQQSSTIGLVLSRSPRAAMAIPFFAEIIGGITEAATEGEHHVLLVSSHSRKEETAQVLGLFRQRRIEGLIHLASRTNDPLIEALTQEGFPFVVIGRVPDRDVPAVNNDNVAAAEMAVNHLLDQGFERIACVGGRPDLVVTCDRLQGYRNALKSRGKIFREDWIVCSESTMVAGTAAADQLLSGQGGQGDERPDAVFAMDDTLAVGVLTGVRKIGLRVPAEFGVVGFNDDPISAMIEPALTTVRIPIFEMGQQAARMLIDGIQNGLKPDSVVVPAELVVRQSSDRPHYDTDKGTRQRTAGRGRSA